MGQLHILDTTELVPVCLFEYVHHNLMYVFEIQWMHLLVHNRNAQC